MDQGQKLDGGRGVSLAFGGKMGQEDPILVDPLSDLSGAHMEGDCT